MGRSINPSGIVVGYCRAASASKLTFHSVPFNGHTHAHVGYFGHIDEGYWGIRKRIAYG